MPRNLGADEVIVTPRLPCPGWNKAGWMFRILWETGMTDHQKLFPCKIWTMGEEIEDDKCEKAKLDDEGNALPFWMDERTFVRFQESYASSCCL
jgi:hypothetical protein